MALNLHFEPEVSYRDLLKPLLSLPFFKLVSLVGCQEPDWIISGYDIEWSIYHAVVLGKFDNRVQIVTEPDNDVQQNYLQEMTHLIQDVEQPIKLGNSPFETISIGHNFTQIESAISTESFEKVMEWAAYHRGARSRLRMQACIKLALKHDEHRSEQWVYRPNVYKDVTHPLLQIALSDHQKGIGKDHINLCFSTNSSVWLRDNLPTGTEESGANLAMFAALAKVVYTANQAQYQDGFMDLDGYHFEAERDHISALLTDIPRIAYVA